ncbi:MAG: hypothetical protein AB1499_08510 [Nitrospirota bacterium]
MYGLLQKSVFVYLIVFSFILGAFSTGYSSGKIKLEKELGIVVPVAGVTDLPNEITLRMFDSNTAAIPLTSQAFPRGEYSAYYNMTKSDGLTEMNVVKFEMKLNKFDKILDYLDTIKRTEDFWIEVDFDGKLIGQREQLDRQITKQILATVTAQSVDTSDPSSAQSVAHSGSSFTSGTATSQVSAQKGATASGIIGPLNVAGSDGSVQYNNGGVQAGASQFYYDDVNHRVGIGTATPKSLLDVATSAGGLQLAAGGGPSIGSNIYYSGGYKYIVNGYANIATFGGGDYHFYTAPSGTAGASVSLKDRLTILASGNVGIGSATPAGNLHIETNGSPVLILKNSTANGAGLTYGQLEFRTADSSMSGANIGAQIDSYDDNGGWGDRAALRFYTNNGVSLGERVRIASNGNVGIGTTSPCVDCKLAVNGKIRAKEIVIDTGWADFVFYDNYTLMPLQEVEKFIKTNQHLPGIPTAADVEKEGVSLGTISAKLLQKIEELTLYVIDMKKENNVLKGDLAVLQKQMAIK